VRILRQRRQIFAWARHAITEQKQQMAHLDIHDVAINGLTRLAKKHGVRLRQSYLRIAKRAG
jgi:hypothetical protein